MNLGCGGCLDPTGSGPFMVHSGGLGVEGYWVIGPFPEMKLGSGHSTARHLPRLSQVGQVRVF